MKTRYRNNGEQMRIESTGVVLSYFRKKYGLTLEQICDGICSPSTLHRLEEGRRCTDSLTSSLLLERIGKQANQFELILNDADYELWLARESILQHMQQKEYVQVHKELAHYRTMKKMVPGIHEQFCLCQEVLMLETELKDNWKEQQKMQDIRARLCETAMRALQLTKPAFAISWQWKNTLYTTMEMELILMQMQYGIYSETSIQVENILSDMYYHIEYYDTGHRKQRLGNRILMKLVYLAQTLQDPDKVLAYIDKGINYIAQSREIEGLDRLRFLRAQTLLKRYRTDVWKDSMKRHEIQEECLMAYSICNVFEDRQQMQAIEQFCEEEMGWQITGLET